MEENTNLTDKKKKPILVRFIESEKTIDICLSIIFICGSMACGNSVEMAPIIGNNWLSSRLIAIILGAALYFTAVFRFMEVRGFKPLVYALSLYLFADSCVGNILVTFDKGTTMPVTSYLKLGVFAVVAVIYLVFRFVKQRGYLEGYYIKDKGLQFMSVWITDVFADVGFYQLGEIVVLIEFFTSFEPRNIAIAIFGLMLVPVLIMAAMYTTYFGARFMSQIQWLWFLLLVGGIIQHGYYEYYDTAFLKTMFDALGLI